MQDPTKNIMMNQLVSKFIQNAYDSPMVKTERLTEVKELPEEEEGDPFILTTRGTSNKKYTRNIGISSRSFTLKLPKKFLPEDDIDDNINESRRTYQQISRLRKMQLYPFQRTQYYNDDKYQIQEDSKTILNCLNNVSEGPVKYVIDDIDIDEIRAAKPKMGMYFSHSLIIPHKSDDPAIDSEDRHSFGLTGVDVVDKEFEEHKVSELKLNKDNPIGLNPGYADKRKAGHRRNKPIVFDQNVLKKVNDSRTSNVKLN